MKLDRALKLKLKIYKELVILSNNETCIQSWNKVIMIKTGLY